MATTTDDLVVRVTVDSSGAVKGFKVVGAETKAVGAAMASTEKLAQQLEKQFGIVGASSIRAARQFDTTSKSFKIVTNSVREVSSVFVAQIRENGQLANAFKGTDQWAAKAAQSFKALASAGLQAADAAGKVNERFKNVRQVSPTAAFPAGPKLANPVKPGAADFAQRSASAVRNVQVTDVPPPKNLGLFQSGLKGISAAAVVMNQALELAKKAFHAIAVVIGSTVGAFIERERAEKLLINTMKRTGGQSETATRDLMAYADAVQETTTVSRDMALQLLATAKSAGLSDDMAKQLVMTAADMSTQFGDVESNFRALTGSLKGEAGELTQFNPKLKDLSEGALRGGAAIKILAQELKGAAAADAKTLGGSLAQLKNQFTGLLASVGHGIVEAFNVPAGIETLISLIKDLRADVDDARANFAAFRAVLSNIGIDFDLTDIIKAFFEFNPIIDVMVISFKAVKAALEYVVTGFLAGARAAEFLGRNIASVDTISNAVVSGAKAIWANYNAIIQESFGKLFGLIASALGAVAGTTFDIGGVAASALGKVNDAIKYTTKQTELWNTQAKETNETLRAAVNAFDTRSFQDKFDVLGGMFATARDDAKKTQIENDKITAPKTDSWKRLAETIRQITTETKLAGNELKAIGAGQTKQIQVALDGELITLAAKREELRVQGLLSAEVEKQIGLQKDYAKQKAALQIADAQLEKLKELAGETADLNDEVKAYALSDIGLIDQQAAAEQTKLALKELQLEKDFALLENGDQLVAGMRAQVAEQRRLVGLKAEEAKKAARSTVSSDMRGKIAEGFGEGAGKAAGKIGAAVGGVMLGPIGAMMQFADMIVGAVQQLIDFIPKIINAVANIFSSLADLPKMITKAVQNLFKSFLKLISDFIPNILNMIPDILNTIVDSLVTKLPVVVSQLFAKIPELLIKVFEELPKILEKALSSGSVTTIAVGFITALVKAMPRVAIAFLKMIYIELPKAIVQGIMTAIQNISDAFSSLFGGKGIQVDTKGIENVVKDIGKQATGVADNVFRVLDLAANAKGMDLADRIRDAIDSSTGRARNMLEKIGAFLKQLWDGVFDFFKNQFGPLVSGAWHDILDFFNNKFGPAVALAWHDILDFFNNIFGPAIAKAWHDILDFFNNVLGPAVGKAWHDVLDFFENQLAPAIGSAWHDVLDFFENSFAPAIGSAWHDVLDFFNNAFGPAIGSAWHDVLDFFSTIGTDIADAFSPVTSLFTAEKISAAFASLTGLFSADGMTAAFTPLTSLFSAESMTKIFKDPLANLDKLTDFKWPTAPSIPDFKWPETPKIPDFKFPETPKIDEFKWPKTTPKVPDFKFPTTPSIPDFKWPTTPTIKFSWPSLPDLYTAGTKAFDGLSAAITNNAKWFGNIGTNIWDGLVSAFQSGVKWLTELFSSIFSNAIPSIGGSGGGKGWVAEALGQARGGIVPRYAAGGEVVRFRPQGTDTQPYMLSPGEGIVNAPAVQRVGTGFIDALNNGAAPGGNNTRVEFGGIHLTIENKGDLNEDFVKRKLMPMFIKEVQFQTLHGRPLIDLKGIRK